MCRYSNLKDNAFDLAIINTSSDHKHFFFWKLRELISNTRKKLSMKQSTTYDIL